MFHSKIFATLPTGVCIDWFSENIGCGTVFQLTPPAAGPMAWTKTTLHNFTTGKDGAVPEGKLLLDSSGALYGTTFQGGTGQCPDSLYYIIGCGIVYQLTPPGAGSTTWTETILHDFAGPEGAHPQGGVIQDNTGALVGTTYQGGPMSYGVLGSYGVAYRLIPPPREKTPGPRPSSTTLISLPAALNPWANSYATLWAIPSAWRTAVVPNSAARSSKSHPSETVKPSLPGNTAELPSERGGSSPGRF